MTNEKGMTRESYRLSLIKLEEPSPEWVKGCIERGFTLEKPHEDERHEILKKKLLSYKGWAVCIYNEEDLEKLLSDRSKLYFAAHLRMKAGLPSQCHFNTCRNHEDYGYKICTGYALTRDGMWRQHSWGLDGRNIIETTTRRILYYGFEMTDTETKEFCYDNI
jgi:hypothetical protein